MEEQENILEVEFGIEVVGLKDLKLKSTTEELRAFVTQVADSYIAQPVTKANLKTAKETRAKLNKVNKLVTDKLKSVKKEMLKPWEELNTEITGILNRLDMICTEVDSGIDAITDAEKAEKRIVVLEQLAELRESMEKEVALILIDYFSDKWLNKTTTAKAIEKDYMDMATTTKTVLNEVGKDKNKALLIKVFKDKWDIKGVWEIKALLTASELEEQERQAIIKKQETTTASATAEKSEEKLMKALFWIYGTKSHIAQAVKNVGFADAKIARASKVTWLTDEDIKKIEQYEGENA